MFKFTIRELLLMTLVVAILVAWGLDHWEQTRRINVWAGRTGDLRTLLLLRYGWIVYFQEYQVRAENGNNVVHIGPDTLWRVPLEPLRFGDGDLREETKSTLPRQQAVPGGT